MRLAAKLTLLLAAAGALPLTATGLTLVFSHDALREQVARSYEEAAVTLAREVDDLIDAKLDDVRFAADAVLLPEMDGEARQAALHLLYEQTRGANIVGLFDATGAEVSPTVYFERLEDESDVTHEPIATADLALYARSIPLAAVLKANVPVVGPPYVARGADGSARPRVVVAVPARGEAGATHVLAVELSLSELAGRFIRYRPGEDTTAMLLDGLGQLVAHPDPTQVMQRASRSELLSAIPAGYIGASARSVRTGWGVVVMQPERAALAPVRRQGFIAAAVAFAGLGLALILGIGTVRAVTKPVLRLRDAASRVQEGDLGAEVPVRGRDELAQLGSAFNAMTQGLRERERLKSTFSRYVSGEIAERILSEDSDLAVKGELVPVTVLFLDVRGFTALSQVHPPGEVVELLNVYFERVVDVVARHEGVVNKFIGDAVMAVFGAPRKIDQPELRAVRAALEIQSVVRVMNAERKAKGLAICEFGAGINSGEVLAGNIGSSQRLEYTLIGDAVNVAERLQGQARGGELITSARTLSAIEHLVEFERRGSVTVKGRSGTMEIFRVLAERTAAAAS